MVYVLSYNFHFSKETLTSELCRDRRLPRDGLLEADGDGRGRRHVGGDGRGRVGRPRLREPQHQPLEGLRAPRPGGRLPVGVAARATRHRGRGGGVGAAYDAREGGAGVERRAGVLREAAAELLEAHLRLGEEVLQVGAQLVRGGDWGAKGASLSFSKFGEEGNRGMK